MQNRSFSKGSSIKDYAYVLWKAVWCPNETTDVGVIVSKALFFICLFIYFGYQ